MDKKDNKAAPGCINSLRTSSISRDLPHLSSYGRGLERPH